MHMWESLSNQPQEQQPQEEQQKIVNLSRKKCVSCATEKTCRWRRSKLLSLATDAVRKMLPERSVSADQSPVLRVRIETNGRAVV